MDANQLVADWASLWLPGWSPASEQHYNAKGEGEGGRTQSQSGVIGEQ